MRTTMPVVSFGRRKSPLVSTTTVSPGWSAASCSALTRFSAATPPPPRDPDGGRDTLTPAGPRQRKQAGLADYHVVAGTAHHRRRAQDQEVELLTGVGRSRLEGEAGDRPPRQAAPHSSQRPTTFH